MQVKNLAEKFIIKYKQPVKMQWQDGFAKTLKSFDLFDDAGKQIFGDPDDCRNGATHHARNWGSPIPFAEEHGIV